MVKQLSYEIAFCLMFVFAAPAFAQDDFPPFQIAPGYGNIGLKANGVSTGRHSGFVMDTDYNFSPWLGAEIFTGYYSLGSGNTLYSNTFGGIAALRKNEHIVPFGVGGFGFGAANGSQSMAYRYGGGLDIPFSTGMALRVSATRMGVHFNNNWQSGMNYSVGIALNLSQ